MVGGNNRMHIGVTVFTPTYNRAYILKSLYESLLRQTVKDFEWIIVDDGSTDNTEELISRWKNECEDFDIKYKKVSNGGKHRAINMGVAMARSNAFFIVDSDDFLADDAIAFIKEHFGEIEQNEEFAAISGLKGFYKNNVPVGGELDFETYKDATNLQREEYNLFGDKAEIYKTSVLKKYPFPEFENEKYISESIVWDRIAGEGLKIRWYNKVIYYCEYLKDGLSRTGLKKYVESPKGWAQLILNAKRGGYWSEQKILQEEYNFVIYLEEFFSKEEICEMLFLSEEEYKELYEKYKITESLLEEFIKEKGWKEMALYGFGKNAKRLLPYLKKTAIMIPYVIDRDGENVEFDTVYDLKDEIPKVDSVCVTIQHPTSRLVDEIRSRMPSTDVWVLTEFFQEKEWTFW